MKERGIGFTAEMNLQIRAGNKGNTRRLAKPQPICYLEPPGVRRWEWHPNKNTEIIWGNGFQQPAAKDEKDVNFERVVDYCPYGGVGDRLWVKETWCYKWNADGPVSNADGNYDRSCIHYQADGYDVAAMDDDGGQKYNKDGTEASPWKSSRFMPRWAARTILEIENVRVERVQEISEADAEAEGTKLYYDDPNRVDRRKPKYREGFHTLWDSINKKRGFGWDMNPWVWAIDFKVVEMG